MNKTIYQAWANRSGHLLRRVAGLMALACLLMAPRPVAGGDVPSLTESQVKALFLLNFTKHVEWPAETFAQADSPIIIGVLDGSQIFNDLKTVAEGKTVKGRAIAIRQIAGADDAAKCQILFIGASEKKRVPEMLARVAGLPILTVGETEQFTQQGGIINFIKKDGKVRLEIDLSASRLAKLQIGSQLLRVADTLWGKP